MHEPTIWLMLLVALGLGVSGMVFGLPFYAMWSFHKRKLEEIKAHQRTAIDQETRAAIEGLRAEMAALRDTTTQYDVSFDTALKRLESRISHVEQKVITAAPQSEYLGSIANRV